MGGEDDGGALGHLVGLVDEDGAAPLEGVDDVLVVHDLLAHVDRGPYSSSAFSTVTTARSTPAR